MSTVHRVVGALPDGFAELRADADAEGFRNMARLAADWSDGSERFDAPGTGLFAAYDDGVLAGVGGITPEPTAPDAPLRRARRFYVRPAFRRRGHGEALVAAIVAAAHGHAHLLVVHSSAFAMPFWDAAGFARSTRPGLTHEREV